MSSSQNKIQIPILACKALWGQLAASLASFPPHSPRSLYPLPGLETLLPQGECACGLECSHRCQACSHTSFGSLLEGRPVREPALTSLSGTLWPLTLILLTTDHQLT